MNTEVIKVIKQIEELGWNVNIEYDTVVELSKYSPAGKDFYMLIDTENNIDCFIENIYKYYDNFDVSYETYLWLDDEGHGVNGAPYDMREVYNDIEACKNNIYKLYQELN